MVTCSGALPLCSLEPAHADEDPVQQAFVQRRATLTQEQWDRFLSRDASASNASLSTLWSSVGNGLNKGADSSYTACGTLAAVCRSSQMREPRAAARIRIGERGQLSLMSICFGGRIGNPGADESTQGFLILEVCSLAAIMLDGSPPCEASCEAMQ